jgi:hypothetical protein
VAYSEDLFALADQILEELMEDRLVTGQQIQAVGQRLEERSLGGLHILRRLAAALRANSMELEGEELALEVGLGTG